MNRSWLLGLLLGCTPELQPIRWDAVDIEALRDHSFPTRRSSDLDRKSVV